jgi:catechol-2,3-dioxygenase
MPPSAIPTAGLCELTLETRDLERMEAFYTRCFGLVVLSREQDRVWLACGPRTRLGLWCPGPKEFGDEGGRHVHFAFSAGREGLETILDRLRAAGAAPRGPVEHEGGDRSIYVEDPEGNVVEVWNYFEDGEGRVDGVAGLDADQSRGSAAVSRTAGPRRKTSTA